MHKIKGVNTVLLVTVVVSVLFSILISFLDMFGIDIFCGSYALQLLYSQIIFVLPALIWLIANRNFRILRFRKIRFSNILLCVLLYLCLSPVLSFLNILSQFYSTNVISTVMFNIGDEMPFGLGLLLIAVIPALCEECTYRGLIYNTYAEASPLAAVILSGVIFGLMHGNLNQFTYATVLGMCFALIVEATDSIWSTFILHFLVNASSTCLVYLLPKALSVIESYYAEAVAAEDTMTMNAIETMMGTTDFTMEAILSGSEETVTNADLVASLEGYIIPAVVGGILAFLLYRCIARRCGRWELVKSIFGGRRAAAEQPNAALQNVPSEQSAAQLNVSSEQPETVADPEPAEQPTAIMQAAQSEQPETVESAERPELPLTPPARTGLVTWQLVAAIVILVGELVITEIALHLA